MRRMVLPVVAVILLGVTPGRSAQGQEPITWADCETAMQSTASAYAAGQQPDPGTEQLARDCSTPVSQDSYTTYGGKAPPCRSEAQTSRRARHRVITLEEVEPRSCGATAGPKRSRTITNGKVYFNGFGFKIIHFQAVMRWSYQNGRTAGQPHEYFLVVERCCFWYYEGVVDFNNDGCWNGCTFVARRRMGSFIFNPPWPSITTRVQPVVRLVGYGDGGAISQAWD
jgi:hypothetical protein